MNEPADSARLYTEAPDKSLELAATTPFTLQTVESLRKLIERNPQEEGKDSAQALVILENIVLYACLHNASVWEVHAVPSDNGYTLFPID